MQWLYLQRRRQVCKMGGGWDAVKCIFGYSPLKIQCTAVLLDRMNLKNWQGWSLPSPLPFSTPLTCHTFLFPGEISLEFYSSSWQYAEVLCRTGEYHSGWTIKLTLQSYIAMCMWLSRGNQPWNAISNVWLSKFLSTECFVQYGTKCSVDFRKRAYKLEMMITLPLSWELLFVIERQFYQNTYISNAKLSQML